MTDLEKKIERERIEWVFGLTGGELSDAPWRYVHESSNLSTDPDNECIPRDADGRAVGSYPFESDYYVRTGAFRYWYDGAPEYAAREHSASPHVRTAVVCALFGMPPAVLWDAADGSRWARVAFYQSSGETECPGANENDGNIVTAAHLPVAGDGSSLSADRCVLCDSKIGEPHGFIYIGDGWGEAVYVRETPRVHFEIIDHGCDGEQYFPGCGVAFTSFTDVATGIGDSAREAAEDAADSMAQSMSSEELDEVAESLDAAIADLSDAPSFDADDPDISPEWHHYVSIRWRVERH